MDFNNTKIIVEVKSALDSVIDPELGMSIVALGLLRDITVHPAGDDEDSEVEVLMTLTSPLCPFADAIIEDVENTVSVLGYGKCLVSLTFDPPWEASEELKLLLGL
jgi:metal-sulfur cluster biosynthetic enzyme